MHESATHYNGTNYLFDLKENAMVLPNKHDNFNASK